MTKIKDNTALVPVVLFIILAAIVTYSIIKGNKKTVIPPISVQV